MPSDDLKNRFEYHPPKSEQVKSAHESIRSVMLHAAEIVEEIVPAGRERALAMTKLEEAMMWANAALARARS